MNMQLIKLKKLLILFNEFVYNKNYFFTLETSLYRSFTVLISSRCIILKNYTVFANMNI